MVRASLNLSALVAKSSIYYCEYYITWLSQNGEGDELAEWWGSRARRMVRETSSHNGEGDELAEWWGSRAHRMVRETSSQNGEGDELAEWWRSRTRRMVREPSSQNGQGAELDLRMWEYHFSRELVPHIKVRLCVLLITITLALILPRPSPILKSITIPVSKPSPLYCIIFTTTIAWRNNDNDNNYYWKEQVLLLHFLFSVTMVTNITII